MKDFPFVVNSEGAPVTPINMYLTSHLNTNKSPSTIKRNAHCLSILNQYCEINKKSFSDFDDNDLVKISYDLKKEKNGVIRNNTTINNILSSIISFYEFFGSMFLNNDNYIKDILNVDDVLKNGKITRKTSCIAPKR